MRGERARIRPEDHLADNPGQLSPGRPDLLTSPVERCRSRPARTRGRAEPACTTQGEKTRVTAPQPRRGTATGPARNSPCPYPANARPSRGQRSKTPDQNLFTTTTGNSPEPLDAPLLTLVIGSPDLGVFAVNAAGVLCAFPWAADTLSGQCLRRRTRASPLVAAAFRTNRLPRGRCSATCQRRRRPGQARRGQGGLQITAVRREF